MLRRRAIMRRAGPGLVGTVAQTAVIAGTAAVTSHAVNNRMAARDARHQQEQMAETAAVQTQAEIDQMQDQLAAMQAQQAQAAMAPAPAAGPAAGAPDLIAQLQQLGQLKEAGVLTEDEFQSAKAKLLAG